MSNLTDSELASRPDPPEAKTKADGPRLLLAFALLCTLAAYSRTLRFDFVYDDQTIILANPAVHSWRYLPQYFSRHFWAGVYPEGPGNYYRPVFLLWLRINNMAFGDHAWGWHLATIFLHLAVTLLVYLLAVSLLHNRWLAAWAALIFGLHPVHIEPVAWVSGATDVLLAALLIGSFLCYLQARRRGEKVWFWTVPSLTLFALALLDKEIAIIMPALIFAYEGLYERPSTAPSSVGASLQSFRQALGMTTPYLLMIGPYLIIRGIILKGLSHPETSLPISTIIFTWPSLFWFWVKHLVWPTSLSSFYDLPAVIYPGFSNFTLPAMGVIALASAVMWWARRSREIALAATWLVLPLLPFLDLRLFVASDYAHDRYLYVPSIGFAIIAACALRHLRLSPKKVLGLPAIPVAATMGMAVLLGYSTERQTTYFQNDVVFYQHNFLAAPHNIYAKLFYGITLGNLGKYQEAIEVFKEALMIDRESWGANYNLGYTYYRLGELDKAERYLLNAVKISPEKAGGYFYLGLTELKMNRLDYAAAAIRRAIAIQPDGYPYHFALGIVLKQQGDLAGALAQFQAELEMRPTQSAAREQITEIEASLKGKPREESLPHQ
jgi:tetratricopeptide (TPR) repeat protein